MAVLTLLVLVALVDFSLAQGQSSLCSNNPCIGGGTCAVGLQDDVYHCICPTERTGRHCEKRIHDCSSDPCQHGGRCCESHNSYSCECKPGFTGNRCETDIDECQSHPCTNGATCIDKVNGFSCTCPSGLTGAICDQKKPGCHSDTCQNSATCVESNDGMWYCVCLKTHKGMRCEQIVNDCSSHPCQNGGSCCDKEDHYECKCQIGYSGVHCEIGSSSVVPSSSSIVWINDACQSRPCLNGGTCSPYGKWGYRCQCSAPHTGNNCDMVFYNDMCMCNPCLNGGTCSTYGMMGYRCECNAPYYGKHCEMGSSTVFSSSSMIRPSSSSPVLSTSTPNLIDSYWCEMNPCRNGGTCVKGGFFGYKCQCNPPYSGVTCEMGGSSTVFSSSSMIRPSSTSRPVLSTSTPILVDGGWCEAYPCRNGGTCVKGGMYGFRCQCNAPYYGVTCEMSSRPTVVSSSSPIRPLSSSQSSWSDSWLSSSSIQPTSSQSVVPSSSSSSEMWINDACLGRHCLNGGTCSPYGKWDYRCQCSAPYYGTNCEMAYLSCAQAASCLFSSSSASSPSSSSSSSSSSIQPTNQIVSDGHHRVKRSQQDTKSSCQRRSAMAQTLFTSKPNQWKALHPAVRDVAIDIVTNGDHLRSFPRTHAQIRRAVATNNLADMRTIMSDRKQWRRVTRDRFLLRKGHLDEAFHNPLGFALKRKSQLVTCE